MTNPAPEVKAGIYCRMSVVAADDDTEKVVDQERISRELAERLRWEISSEVGWPEANGVYQDNNRSAWRKDKIRPGWEAMFADIEAGRINAAVIYHGDRLIRQPRDLERLIDMAEAKGVKLASPTGMRDLGNRDDHFILRIEAAMACRESDNTSRRRKQQYIRWRREGKVRPGGRGGRAFGFDTKNVVVWPEAELVREAAQRILAGEGASQVAAWLNGCGAVTPAGRPFAHTTVRKMLARPRYAGLMPDGAAVAAWEPILDRETWEAVAGILDARAAGFSYATNARKYLLSGIAKCVCGSGLQLRAESKGNGTKDGYGCIRPGCRKVQRNIILLDGYITARLVARLAREGNPAGRIPERPGLAAEFAALAQARTELVTAIEDHAQGHLPLLLRRLDSMDKRLAELRETAADSAGARLLANHAGLTEEGFAALPLSVRRSLVSAAFEITVMPASRRGPGFNTADVRVTPR